MYDARVFATLRKMIQRRGFDTPAIINESHTLFCKPGKRLLMYYLEIDNRGGVGVVREITKKMHALEVEDAIIICGSTTPPAYTAFRDLLSQNLHITVFSPASLMFDIFEHHDVPHHRILSAAEKHTLLISQHLQESDLPIIRLDDAMAKYLGARVSDVFEITRIRPNVGAHFYYRIVRE